MPVRNSEPKGGRYENQNRIFVGCRHHVAYGNFFQRVRVVRYYMTLVFNKSQVTIYTMTCDTFIDTDLANAGTSKGVKDGTIGVYNEDGTLVTEGVEVRYSTGDDYVTGSSGNVYYVKSVKLPIDSLRESYKLALYINSSVMGVQFCEPNETVSTGTYSATLTLDLESGKGVDSIESLIGVETRGEASQA